jgi:hypothetical protein
MRKMVSRPKWTNGEIMTPIADCIQSTKSVDYGCVNLSHLLTNDFACNVSLPVLSLVIKSKQEF